MGVSAVELTLASPATGPVERVWYSPDGAQLLARTAAGKVFSTTDYETWKPAEPVTEGPLFTIAANRLPEAGARLVAAGANPQRVYALGRHLFRSEDGGRSWTNLTQYRSDSVVGIGQHSLAVSPVDPDQLVLANDFGVWRSADGGLSWAGLNQFLPNLAIHRIVSTPTGTAGTRVEADGFGLLELPPGGSVWFRSDDGILNTETALRRQYSSATRAEITAFATSGSTVYAGSADGRLWVSLDSGQTFRLSRTETAGPVERIFSDPTESRVALVALGGNGPHVLRTTSSGSLWDDLSGNLPNVAAHGVAADRAAGAVYVATDRGVFLTHTDLENATLPVGDWSSLTDTLPAAAAMDVRLDPAGVQLYIALDGYGIYAAPAPHRMRNFRIVSAADFSARPAAPGSLLSVIGGRVNAARGGNLNYPVLSASETESQIQVPFEAVGPNVALSLQTVAGPVTLGLPVQSVSPAVFVGSDGVPMLYDADTGLALDARNPAHSNGRIQILATGLGRVRPDWPTNMQAPLENPPAVIAAVRVYLDGAPLQVTRATLAPGYIGFYLIEAQLPMITNLGTSELHLTAEGQESNRVQIVTEP
ncbi:MAG: hypothetical protein C5B51_03300 [Terriglobia bacterium]|nr:MAG: hypothetical protein C5B51_03300 [Terriglobia bacterium]